MNNKLSGWDDTIVALATAPGIGAIGVIRISGKDAFTIINELFPSKNLLEQPSHTIHVGLLKDDNEPIDEVVVSLFKGPKSYTGEDTIEISGHGSPFVLEQIINACLRHGARMAKPGEFTQRAFLNGKLDLTQAESVADLIIAGSKAAQKTALHNIRGGFSKDLQYMRDQLIQFASLIELELDFATEDVEFADREKFFTLINLIGVETDKLIASFQLGNVIKKGVSVAIIGKPNAGKSTLLNCLLNEERAIVSEIAGTTRDTIEEQININGILFRLIDTAGIRNESKDVIENIGISSDGQSSALMNPSPLGQMEALTRAWSGIDPSYDRSMLRILEGHGTATNVVDQVEIDTIKSFFGKISFSYVKLNLRLQVPILTSNNEFVANIGKLKYPNVLFAPKI